MKDYRKSYSIITNKLTDFQLFEDEEVQEALQDISELIDIAITPVCENCEPTDLDTAKIKLRLMASESNRRFEEYEREIATLKNCIRKRG